MQLISVFLENESAMARSPGQLLPRLRQRNGTRGGRSRTGAKIQTALERAGVEFIDENGGGPGVRLRKPVRGKSGKV